MPIIASRGWFSPFRLQTNLSFFSFSFHSLCGRGILLVSNFGADETVCLLLLICYYGESNVVVQKAIVPFDEFYSKLYNTAPEVAELIHAAFGIIFFYYWWLLLQFSFYFIFFNWIVPIPSKNGQDKVSCFAWSTFLSFYYRSPHDVLQSTCSLFPDQYPSLLGFVHNLRNILLHPLSPDGIPSQQASPLPSSPSQFNQGANHRYLKLYIF